MSSELLIHRKLEVRMDTHICFAKMDGYPHFTFDGLGSAASGSLPRERELACKLLGQLYFLSEQVVNRYV